MKSLYETFQPKHNGIRIFSYLIPFAIIYICYQIEIDLTKSKKRALFVFMTAMSLLLVDIHLVYIDEPSNLSSQYFPDRTNLQFQQYMHADVMNLDPVSIPHCYRFLPDSIVSLLTYLNNDFELSKMIYREAFMFLLIFAIYYYSRLYSKHEVAIITILIYSVLYQITIRNYAGQLTDPLSHLTFILSFIFLELDLFIYFTLAILVGILAKETIIIMPVLYLIIHKPDKMRSIKALCLLMFAFGILIGIRLLIKPDFTYIDISASGTVDHIIKNLSAYPMWYRPLFYTIGIFLPFIFIAWRSTTAPVKKLVIFLLPTLVLSNVVFSWLEETRNFIPVIIPMALLTANFLTGGANLASEKELETD